MSPAEYQHLLIATALCKAEQTDDCADICFPDHEDDTSPATRYPCPGLPKESNFALCPVKPADIGCYESPADTPTPLQILRQNTNITGTSDCIRHTSSIGSGSDKIGIYYPQPEKKELPHQRHRFEKNLVDSCELLQYQIKRAEKKTGCSITIHE